MSANAEQEYRFNTREQKDGERFAGLLREVNGKRLAHRDLVEEALSTIVQA